MSSADAIQRVRIYLRESERSGEQPLYLALLDQLRREGASSASATRALAGFDASERLRAGGPDALANDPPIVVEWIDRAERVARLLPLLDSLVPEALITLEQVGIYRAALHHSGAFPTELLCRQLASSPPTLSPNTPATEAAALVATHGALAVLDEAELAVGILSAGDVQRRGGLALPLNLLPALSDDEQAGLLASLASRRVSGLMTAPPRAISADAPVAQAAATMVEWGFGQLSLIDRQGRYQGMLTLDDVLAAAAPSASSNVRPAGQATSVALVMQTALPQIAADAPLALLLERLLANPAHYLLVSDAENRLLGYISAALLLQRLGPDLRPVLVQMFGGALQSPALQASPLQARDLAAPTPSIEQSETLFAAVQALLQQELGWLPVTSGGKLTGLLGRAGLLRALAQEGIG